MKKDFYTTMSKYYDGAYAAKDDLVDSPFYLNLSKEIGGPVLELGCGTGRISLAIAHAGIEIAGVDASPAMLEVFRGKLRDEPDAVQRRVTIHEGDLRDVQLSRSFPLIIIPFRAMQHMYTVEDQLSALRCAKDHLTGDGVLAFDVFFPDFKKISSGVGEEVLELEWSPNDSDGVIRRYFTKEEEDRVNLNFSGRFTYRTYEGEKLVNEEHTDLKLGYYTYPHLQLLFKAVGLEPVQTYGCFDGKPLTNESPEMIFLLKPAT